MAGDPPRFDDALAAATRVVALDPKNVRAAWRGAWAAFELADEATKNDVAAQHAAAGLQLAEKGVALSDACGECHYYLALNLGIVARTRTTAGALEMVKKVAAHAKKAMAMVPTIGEGGPGRLLGILYARVPAWPTSFGDLEEAVRLLKAVVQKHPDFPLNRLFLAEALMLDKRYDDARGELKLVLTAPREGEWGRVGKRWRKEARKLMRRITLREKDEE